MAYAPKRRRPGPSWVGTIVVIVAIVGYCLYTAARLRGAVRSPAHPTGAALPSGSEGAPSPSASRVQRSTGGDGDRSLDVSHVSQQ